MNVETRSLKPDSSELKERIEALGPWFHNIKLGGIWTAPEHFLGDYPNEKFQRFAPHLPADLSGKSVLDIGCNAGFYSMEMKRRGADRVLGIDSDDRYLAQARLAGEALGYDNIEFRKLDVYDVGALGEKFDVVIDRKSTRLNSSHANISYAVFCLKKKRTCMQTTSRAG